jgi:ribosome-binding ATPase YchF (GTP1/OBG family)
LGLEEPAQDRLIREVYALLDLISFLTAGEDEVRAWTCERGTHAPRAAGKIHSDLSRGFIRAEVVAYDDFVAAKSSMTEAKKAGKVRLEGKDYVVKDGDIVNFRFNV